MFYLNWKLIGKKMQAVISTILLLVYSLYFYIRISAISQ